MGRRHKTCRVKGHCNACGRSLGNGKGNNSNWKRLRQMRVGSLRRPTSKNRPLQDGW